MSSVALLWDIDGTLLTTARAGVLALEAALEETTGQSVDLHGLVASGLTEHQVARAVFDIARIDADEEQIDRLLRAYESYLPSKLPLREGSVLPGVREVLTTLAGDANVHSYILTGNTPAGARAKLSHYGLLEFFDDGAYCIDAGPRSDIARRAAALANGADVVYVIGDTPHDIDCGKAIDARTIAIATGSYGAEALLEHDPWLVLERIDPAAFVRLVTEDTRP